MTLSPTEIDELRQELTEIQLVDILRKIKTDISPSCFVCYAKGEVEHETIIYKLAKHLSTTGLQISIDIWDRKPGTRDSVFIERIEESDYVLLAGSKPLKKQYDCYRQEKKQSCDIPPSCLDTYMQLEQTFNKLREKSGHVIPLLLEGEMKTSFPSFLQGITPLNMQDRSQYSSQVFELTERLLGKDLSPFIREFKELQAFLYSEEISFEELLKAKREAEEKGKALTAKAVVNVMDVYKAQLAKVYTERELYHAASDEVSQSKQFGKYLNIRRGLKKKNLLILSLLSASTLCASLYYFSDQQPKYESNSIRSDLVIPVKSSLLERPQLMAEIKGKLKADDDISLIAIVGMGGAGKTTLARQFGRSYKASVVWEINAETQTSLANSFKDLAEKLANTEELKKELNSIQDIREAEERGKKLLAFVKDRLKGVPSWLLIYDNVESLSTLGSYLPQDANVWGRSGKIILTTRNANIKEHHSIKPENIIQIEILTPEESLTLFSKIRYGCDSKQLPSTKKEATLSFLKSISPFPLDVSLAAFYIKNNNLSDKEYLNRVAKFNQDFEASQQALLKEIGDYAKTRYGIITSSLAKLIETNKEFQDLLLLICLLDSQNIPKDLLESYKNHTLVDSFIREVKKYSLITAEPPTSFTQLYTFSIHRSTQAIGLAYFTGLLNLEKNNEILMPITKTLEEYIVDVIDKEDFQKIKILVSHCETFMGHRNLFINTVIGSLGGKLGVIYFYLGHYMKAKETLENSLEVINKSQNHNNVTAAQILVYLGAVYVGLGQYKQAQYSLEQGLSIYKKYIPNNYLRIAESLDYLGLLYRNLGDHEKAKNLYSQVLLIYKKYAPENYARIARTLGYLGWIYRNLGNYEKAKELVNQSLTLYRSYFPENHINIAWATVYLGVIYRDLGNYSISKILLENSLLIYREYFSDKHVDVANILEHLGNIYKDLGDYKNAKILLEKTLKIYKEKLSENHTKTALVSIYLGSVYGKLGNYAKAKSLIKKSLKIYESNYGGNHTETARLLRDLGLVYLQEGQLETAEELLVKALGIFQQSKHSEIYLFLEGLTDLFIKKSSFEMNRGNKQLSQDFKKQAIDYLGQALATVKEHFPADSPHIVRIQNKLNAIDKQSLNN